MSQSATISTLGIADHALTWLAPRPPQPTTAIRTVSLGLAKPRTAAPAVSTAVLIRKSLRSIVRASNYEVTVRRVDAIGPSTPGLRGDTPRAGPFSHRSAGSDIIHAYLIQVADSGGLF